MPLAVIVPAPPPAPGLVPAPAPQDPYPTGDDPAETMTLLLGGVVGDPAAHGRLAGDFGDDDRPELPATRRRGALVALAAVVAVAVIGTAALAAGLLDGDGETEDRAAVPTVTTSASENVAVSEAPSPSSSASTATTPATSPSSPTTSPSARTTAASVSTSTSGTATAASTGAAGPRSPSPSTSRSGSAPAVAPTRTADEPTLRRGDSGAEVRELQKRLRQVGVYEGRADGVYDRDVEVAVARYQSYKYIPEDPEGVYGPHTRRALEADTRG
ncbi:peptidoglycan-binding protein [Streptomyces sp. NPDC093600]|uniref:peptidoglycan-binding domain-containing protein n=1 Tax=Streptomyces sp. NPDC093600 TaxID=3366047 RepID=UPI0037F2B6F6